MTRIGRLVALVIVALVLSYAARQAVDRQLDDDRATRSGWVARLPLGVRAWMAQAAWLRAEDALDRGRLDRYASDVRGVLQVHPDDEFARSYFARQMAFSVASAAGSPAVAEAWISEALGLLDEGLRRYPASSMLLAQRGEIYLDLHSRDPRLREAFRAADGTSVTESALDSYLRARDADARRFDTSQPGPRPLDTSRLDPDPHEAGELGASRDGKHRDDAGTVKANAAFGRWNPQIVWCSFLAMEERIARGAFEIAGDHAERVVGLLESLREADPGAFDDAASDAGARWLGRARAWRDVCSGMVRRSAALREGDTVLLEETTRFVTKRLHEIRERYPEDELAKELRDADDLAERRRSR